MAGKYRKNSRFHWEIVLIFAFLDFATLVGLHVLGFSLGLLELNGAASDLRDRALAAVEWSTETLLMPMLAVSGLTWYGVIINIFLHGFLVERAFEFFRFRAAERSEGNRATR